MKMSTATEARHAFEAVILAFRGVRANVMLEPLTPRVDHQQDQSDLKVRYRVGKAVVRDAYQKASEPTVDWNAGF